MTLPGLLVSTSRQVRPSDNTEFGQKALGIAAMGWVVSAALGQLIFATYIASFYGRSTLSGHPERWNEVMNRGFIAGDHVFNWVLGLHLLMALTIILGGLLQLLPAVRRHAPAFHRWNGRVYMVLATALALGGLSLVWIRRGAAGDLPQHLGTSFNAVLILWFVAMAWRAARNRNFEHHRRWALRLFLAVSGVWFFRVGLMLWLAINQAPVGFDPKSFTGPTLTSLAFLQTLLPLALLQGYFLAKRTKRPAVRLAVVVMLSLSTLATLGGGAAATMIMWWPNMGLSA
ncbi:hypothetical protein XaraCFBP7407_06125 [Xanthomonas arboricola pv. arracaciae]|uniref:DUF2306 domain-containing protein n=1 Tax=Xanthomonas arboricola TaxID=56448 RepID=UPI000CEE7920|nr:DUF2306 domain-containing protein [Xanthomonas arboricola]PPT97586.1 hypothetical protein XaraCFBP7407_06125 [Xanthomonas arboricola pv. arracaciae]